ncbi:membrane protein [Tangfeifania diversioriginum]|uniref:Membrane protein n=1 Tax=Tangfeifania diversioriginum TaxID=1168035 RepID=A0A1M6B6N4_9BACT|nr:YihY/virulence factor BrkB family protein [Tangfeifania diversioriginum]SHI44392.1 membrane protein [Tangfeifania diversioriginum]
MYKNNLVTKITDGFKIVKKALLHFNANRPIEHAGTTAFFAIFSMAPILIIIISVFGYFAGDDAIREKLFDEINLLLGSESTRVLRNAITNYKIAENSSLGTIIGIGFFLVSATTLFSAMQNSINYIWRIKIRTNLKMSVLNLLKTRALSFGVILSLGFVLLVSLVVDASIGFLKDFLSDRFSPDFVVVAQILNALLSLVIIATVFTFIYRFLPDVQVRWSASWFGAVFTSVLFAVGKYAIGLFIGNSNLGVVYGTASSFVVILIWIYFVSIIFYFGVELTCQYSKFYRHEMTPAKYAVPFEIARIKE